MTRAEAGAKMAALVDSIARLTDKRDELREKSTVQDMIHANSLDKEIGDRQERLAELEHKYPTAAQELDR